MKYELYYNTCGHGGPYPNLEIAWEAAKHLLKGARTMSAIELRPVNSPYSGGYNRDNGDSMFMFKPAYNCLWSGYHLPKPLTDQETINKLAHPTIEETIPE